MIKAAYYLRFLLLCVLRMLTTNPFRNNQHTFRHTSLLSWAIAHTEEEKKCKALQRKKVKRFTVLNSKEFKLPPTGCAIEAEGVTSEAKKRSLAVLYSLFLFEGWKLGEAFLSEWDTPWSWIRVRIWSDETPMFNFLLKACSDTHTNHNKSINHGCTVYWRWEHL